MSSEENVAERDAKVLQLFVAGASYRQIAAAVGVASAEVVHEIVRREIEQTAARREVLAESASAVFVERSEALFRAHWGPALRGDHKSAEICRRILEQQGRMFAAEPQAPSGEPDTVEDSTFDELARRRTGRDAVPAGRQRSTGNQ